MWRRSKGENGELEKYALELGVGGGEKWANLGRLWENKKKDVYEAQIHSIKAKANVFMNRCFC